MESLAEPKPDEEVIGIITLEDVIEELIQEEIYDECDIPDGLSRYQMGQALRLAKLTNVLEKKKLTQSDKAWQQEPLASASPKGGIQTTAHPELQGQYSYEADETTALLSNCSFP